MKDPLYMRLYFKPVYTEVAKMIGYEGKPMPEASKLAQPLAERFGKAAVQDAADEITTADSSTNPPTLRLTDEARKLCWQLLGPPPEHPLYKELHPEPEAQAEPEKKPKRSRSRAR